MLFLNKLRHLSWYLVDGDVTATPMSDLSRRFRRLVKPKIASTLRDVAETDGSNESVSRGDVSIMSPTSPGDVSETSSQFLSRLMPDTHVASRRNTISGDGRSLTIAACMVLALSEIFMSSCVVWLCVCASATHINATE